MAIISVADKLDAISSKQDSYYNNTYTRVIQVITDTPKTLARTVRLGCGVSIGNHYLVIDPDDGVTILEQDTGSFARSVSAAPVTGEDGCQWDVTVEYGPAEGSNLFPANPIDHPLKLSWGSIRVEEAVTMDAAATPAAILNSAGDYFDPPPTRDRYLIVLKIVRNEATFSPTLAQTWKGTVNNAVFTIASHDFAAKTVKIVDITSELANNPNAPAPGWYWPVNYEFEIDPDGWQAKILDQGMRTKAGSVKKVAVDDGGKEVTSPILLDGSGGKLASGSDPVIKTFTIFPESDFSLLGFDFTGAPGY